MAISKTFTAHTELKASDLNELKDQANVYIQQVDNAKPDTVDILGYISEGSELPLSAHYTYGGLPTVVFYGHCNETEQDYVAICTYHCDTFYSIYLYVKNDQNKYIYSSNFHDDDAETTLEQSVANMISGTPVSLTRNGLMTSNDKIVLDELDLTVNGGVVNYNIGYLQWSVIGGSGTIIERTNDYVHITSVGGNITFGKNYALNEINANAGDTVYFGAKNITSDNKIALVFICYNGGTEIERKSATVTENASFIKESIIIPTGTTNILIRFQSTLATYFEAGLAIIANEDFNENTIFSDGGEGLVQKVEDMYTKSEVNALLAHLNTKINQSKADIEDLEEYISGQNTDIKDDLVIRSSAENKSGYYTGTVGNTIVWNEIASANSIGYNPIDLTEYIGKSLYMKFEAAGTGSRISALCNSSGLIGVVFPETTYNNEIEISPTSEYHYLYVSFPVQTSKSLLYLKYTEDAEIITEVLDKVEDEIEKAASKNNVYVSPNGNDDNTGTLASPVKTIAQALNLSNRVIMLEGTYQGETIVPMDYNYEEISIKAEEAHKVVINFATNILVNDGSEILHSGNVYKVECQTFPFAEGATHARMWQDYVNDPFTLIPLADRHPLQRGKTHRCDSTLIEQCASIAAIEALPENKFGFYWENGYMYFSRPQQSSASHPIVIPTRGASLINMNGNKNLKKQIKINLNNLEIRYGGICLSYTSNCKIADVACKYNYAQQGYQGGCFYLYAVTNCELIRCEAAGVTDGNSVGDGFNVDTAGTADDATCKSLSLRMVDCWAHDIHDDGYSDHDNSEVTIDGGLFEYCGKGGLTPAYGSNDVIRDAICRYNDGAGILCCGNPDVQRVNTNVYAINCICYGQKFGLRAGQASSETQCQIHAYNCMTFGNSNAGYYAAAGHIFCFNCTSDDINKKVGNVTVQNAELLM